MARREKESRKPKDSVGCSEAESDDNFVSKFQFQSLRYQSGLAKDTLCCVNHAVSPICFITGTIETDWVEQSETPGLVRVIEYQRRGTKIIHLFRRTIV